MKLDDSSPQDAVRAVADAPAMTVVEGKTPKRRIKAMDRCLTETGLAEALVELHGRDLRYCGTRRKWLVWTGKVWREDHQGVVQQRIKEMLRRLRADAVSDGNAEAEAFLLKAEKRAIRDNIKSLAEHEAPIQISHDALDAHPMLLNVRNGTVNLETGEHRPHAREDFLTRVAPVSYDVRAPCPVWDAFLTRIFNGDPSLLRYVQKAAGYSLTGNVSEQVIFVLWGAGANGKSTFVLALLEALGDYGRSGVADLLLASKHARHPTEKADLFGARLVVFQETSEGHRFDESKLKELTGGDKIKARRMREDFWEFFPTHKLWLATNHRPSIRGTDHAIWRRIKLIPFTVTIPSSEQDKNLSKKLRRELPGILRWAVEGATAWQRDGLDPPKIVQDAGDSYRQSEDRVAAFISECCIVGPGKQTAARDLYSSYRDWAQANGEHVMSAKAFGERLEDKGLKGGKGGHDRHAIRCGIGLSSSTRDDAGLSSGSSPTRAREDIKRDNAPASSRDRTPARLEEHNQEEG